MHYLPNLFHTGLLIQSNLHQPFSSSMHRISFVLIKLSNYFLTLTSILNQTGSKRTFLLSSTKNDTVFNIFTAHKNKTLFFSKSLISRWWRTLRSSCWRTQNSFAPTLTKCQRHKNFFLRTPRVKNLNLIYLFRDKCYKTFYFRNL